MLSTDHLDAREQFDNNIFHWTRVNKDTQRFPGMVAFWWYKGCRLYIN